MFDFEAVKREVVRNLPGNLIGQEVFYSTFDKNGKPHLLVYLSEHVPIVNRLHREDVFIRYYEDSARPLSFIGRFFDFISQALDFAYFDDWGNIHLFVVEDYMSRAYGFKHNNIEALKLFIGINVHIYPSRDSYRSQVRQSIINRLILMQHNVLQHDLNSILESQRGIFKSIDDIKNIKLEEEEEKFHRSYDFDQAMRSYIIGLDSSLIHNLSRSLDVEPEEKFAGITKYAALKTRLNISIHHIKYGNNNGEWETIYIGLPDGETSVKFYEKPSIKKWNKAVIEKSNSALARLVVPYFLNSLKLALILEADSRKYLEKF